MHFVGHEGQGDVNVSGGAMITTDYVMVGSSHTGPQTGSGALTRIDAPAWKDELHSHDELFGKLGARLPAALETRRGRMHEKLAA